MESPKHERRTGSNPLIEDEIERPTPQEDRSDRTWDLVTLVMTVSALLIMAVLIILA